MIKKALTRTTRCIWYAEQERGHDAKLSSEQIYCIKTLHTSLVGGQTVVSFIAVYSLDFAQYSANGRNMG